MCSCECPPALPQSAAQPPPPSLTSVSKRVQKSSIHWSVKRSGSETASQSHKNRLCLQKKKKQHHSHTALTSIAEIASDTPFGPRQGDLVEPHIQALQIILLHGAGRVRCGGCACAKQTKAWIRKIVDRFDKTGRMKSVISTPLGPTLQAFQGRLVFPKLSSTWLAHFPIHDEGTRARVSCELQCCVTRDGVHQSAGCSQGEIGKGMQPLSQPRVLPPPLLWPSACRFLCFVCFCWAAVARGRSVTCPVVLASL